MATEAVPNDHHKAHYDKFTQHEKELGNIKGDVGIIQSNVDALTRGQVALQESMSSGFRSVNETIESKSNQPAKIGAGLLATFITVVLAIGIAGISALWLTITLLVAPLAGELSSVEINLDRLNEQRVSDSYRHGQDDIKDRWLRDDVNELKGDFLRNEALPQHSQHNTH